MLCYVHTWSSLSRVIVGLPDTHIHTFFYPSLTLLSPFIPRVGANQGRVRDFPAVLAVPFVVEHNGQDVRGWGGGG